MTDKEFEQNWKRQRGFMEWSWLIAEARRARTAEAKLRDVIETLAWMGPETESGDETCVYCGSRRFLVGDGPPSRHFSGCLIDDALRETKP